MKSRGTVQGKNGGSNEKMGNPPGGEKLLTAPFGGGFGGAVYVLDVPRGEELCE